MFILKVQKNLGRSEHFQGLKESEPDDGITVRIRISRMLELPE
jgi:hypothetical protein